jgi:hypothetical protein
VILHRFLGREHLETHRLADVICTGGDSFTLEFLVLGTGFAVDAATGALFELELNEVFVESLPPDER